MVNAAKKENDFAFNTCHGLIATTHGLNCGTDVRGDVKGLFAFA